MGYPLYKLKLMILDKEKTKDKIINHVKYTKGMTINEKAFKAGFRSKKDILEACEFCKVDPIYID